MNFIFEQIRTGGDRNLAYLLGDRGAGKAALVDPSWDPALVVSRARAQRLEVEWVINTHGHPDHVNGNEEAQRLTGARIAAHRDAPIAIDQPLEGGETLEVGSLRLAILHVPGHCGDHILVHLAEQKLALTGDLIFVGKIGGTSGDRAARVEFESLRRVLEALPDETTLWPGHDYGCRPATTVALEKATNPFLLRIGDFSEFLELKRDWARFKRERGLV